MAEIQKSFGLNLPVLTVGIFRIPVVESRCLDPTCVGEAIAQQSLLHKTQLFFSVV
jgi:hypothetical protein